MKSRIAFDRKFNGLARRNFFSVDGEIQEKNYAKNMPIA
jgi:hypothetical protein